MQPKVSENWKTAKRAYFNAALFLTAVTIIAVAFEKVVETIL